MEDLSAIFGMLGLFGLIFFTIVTIINKIKRNGKRTKKYMLISLALFIVGLFIPSESSTPKQPEEQKQEATEIKDKPEKEVKKEANKKEKEEPKQKKEANKRENKYSKEVTNKDTQKESEEEISEKETITKNKSEKKTDSSNKTKKIYDAARAIPVMSGFNTEKIGEMSLIKTDSALVDEDVLLDWYLNYVEETDYLYYIISYVDKEEQLGVYANSSGLIEVNTQIEKDENNVFMLGDDSKATYYTVGEDNKLKKIEF